MGIYKIRNPDGSVTYTGSRPASGRYEEVGPDGGKTQHDADYDHAQVKKLIKEAQKRIPKVPDYLEYLSYLRNYNPMKFQGALKDLERTDAAAWMALQKHPQFRPIRETTIGLKAANRHLEAGIGFSSGNISGTVEKWLESTVKDMMKRDRFGPYADVLGPNGTPPETPKRGPPARKPAPHVEWSEKAAKAAGKELEASRAAVRASRATAVTRVGGPLIDLGASNTPSTARNAFLRHTPEFFHQGLTEDRVDDSSPSATRHAGRLISQSMMDFISSSPAGVPQFYAKLHYNLS